MKLQTYTDKNEVAAAFSKYIAQIIIDSSTPVHIALSGGSTPKVVFDYLAANYKDSIEWSKVHLYWGDERCVPPTDAESNYKMTVDHLLSKITIPADNIHRVLGEMEPKDAAKVYQEVLDTTIPKANGMPQFDVVILGMGDDGHTASIFPHEISLWDAPQTCVVAVHPESGQRRVSLSGGVINNAKNVVFLVTGAGKKEKVTEIINQTGAFNNYPANLVKPTHGELVWFLDTAAAAV